MTLKNLILVQVQVQMRIALYAQSSTSYWSRGRAALIVYWPGCACRQARLAQETFSPRSNGFRRVATNFESITPNSRTLLVELHLDNPINQIQPGSYAQARLTPGALGQIV